MTELLRFFCGLCPAQFYLKMDRDAHEAGCSSGLHNSTATRKPVTTEGPTHYRQGQIEPRAFFDANPHLGWKECNVIKYVYRHKSKGEALKDLKKARVYIDWLIEDAEKGQ